MERKEVRKRGRPAKHKAVSPEAYKPAAVQADPLRKDAPAENYFVLCNGQPVKNVKELADVMERLEEHVFSHHVRPDKNDFANWVKEVFKDAELAEKIAGSKDRKSTQLVIYKHLAHKLW